MTSLAEEISKSSGSINSLVHRLSSQQEGELARREADVRARETALAENRQQLAERKLQLELRRKKLKTETDELAHLEREAKLEFESTKAELKADVYQRELDSAQEQRATRNRTIDMEVEVKRIR